MSETAKVRLVRCPKCENLLPEVTDYSVYQCGGCGAVLRGTFLLFLCLSLLLFISSSSYFKETTNFGGQDLCFVKYLLD